jgi:hypothetical protein
MRTFRTLPSDGNDALAHDARPIHFRELSEATTMSCFAGNLQLVAHVCFFFVNFLDGCASIRITHMETWHEEFDFCRRFVFEPKPSGEHKPRNDAVLPGG